MLVCHALAIFTLIHSVSDHFVGWLRIEKTDCRYQYGLYYYFCFICEWVLNISLSQVFLNSKFNIMGFRVYITSRINDYYGQIHEKVHLWQWDIEVCKDFWQALLCAGRLAILTIHSFPATVGTPGHSYLQRRYNMSMIIQHVLRRIMISDSKTIMLFYFYLFSHKITLRKLQKSSALKPPLLATALEPNLWQFHPFPALVFAKPRQHDGTSSGKRRGMTVGCRFCH